MQQNSKNNSKNIWIVCVNNFIFVETKPKNMITTKIYKGIQVTHSYCPSNVGGTIDFFCIINGKTYRSPSWSNLKKTINKKIK
jgi:hypothetical protein